MSGIRLRLLLATAGLVLATVGIGTWATERTTRGHFAVFERADARHQVFDLSLYLEAWLNHTGEAGHIRRSSVTQH